MRNLILIAYSFPPDRNIGAIRPRGIAKYLPYYGWNVFVITPLGFLPRDSRYNVIETYPTFRIRLGYWKRRQNLDYRRVVYQPSIKTRLVSNFFEIVPFPDTKSGWIFHAVFTAIQIIKRNRIDAIISTYSPASSHFIGHKLKKLFPDLIWIADFRDLWSHNHFRKRSRLSLFLFEQIEKKVLSNADFLTTVSDPLAQKLKRLHKRDCITIPNGFDPEEYEFRVDLDKKFSITYTGSLYDQMNPEILFSVIRKMLSEDDCLHQSMEVNFYTRYNPMLEKLTKKYGIENIIKQRGIVPREEILRKQKSSQILLLITPLEKGVYTGKLFEYLGARRPVLGLGYRDSVVKNLLEETNAGFYFHDENQLFQQLKKWYIEWQKTGFVKYTGEDRKVEQYCQKKMAEKFALLLEHKLSTCHFYSQ